MGTGTGAHGSGGGNQGGAFPLGANAEGEGNLVSRDTHDE
jgi:hypothetical protein